MEAFSLENDRKRYRNMDLRHDIRLKIQYFKVTRKITGRWVLFIILASALQFLARLCGSGFEVAEFVALITTTTATLVGFWAIVGAYLFPKRGKLIGRTEGLEELY